MKTSENFNARLIISRSPTPLVLFDPDHLYWSQEHLDGTTDTYNGSNTFTNKVDINSLKRICTVRLRTPSYGYFILNILQKDIVEAMKNIGFSIDDADYYMIDSGRPVEIDKYSDTDIEFVKYKEHENNNVYTDQYLYSRTYKYGQEIMVTFYKNT